ncbi:MAG: NosD domain-containing protein [Promethearchaeota archaeon]
MIKKKNFEQLLPIIGLMLIVSLTFGNLTYSPSVMIPIDLETQILNPSVLLQNSEPSIAPKSSEIHSPIFINGDDDWPLIVGVTGSGTFADPYIIADLIIDADGSTGISIYYSHVYGIIQNCTIFNGYVGISTTYSSNITLTENTIANNSYDGISIFETLNCTLTGNIVTNNSNDGIYVRYSPNCTLTGNNVSNNLVHGIYLSRSSNSTLIENIVNNNVEYGIYASSSSNCTLNGNLVTNNVKCAIILMSSPNCTLKWNNVTNNLDDGILLMFSWYSIVVENIAVNNSGDGFSLIESSNCTLIGNSASYNSMNGIYSISSNCTLTGNIFNRNSEYGIYLYQTTKTNYVFENWVSKNLMGAILDTGLDNDIHDNIIINCLNVSFTASSSIVFINVEVIFTDLTIGGNSTLLYLWNFGDDATSTLQNSTHSYVSTGVYTVTLTVTDRDDDFASYTSTITVVDDIEPNALFAVSSSTVNVVFVGFW